MTSADFYVQKNGQLVWYGTMKWDGYPYNPDLKDICSATTESAFLQALDQLANTVDEFVWQSEGYPLPNETSALTPYTYVLMENGFVSIYKRGKPFKEGFPRIKFPSLNDIRQPGISVRTTRVRVATAGEAEEQSTI